jgi:hypothetical protein
MNTLGELDPWRLVIWTGKSSRTIRLTRADETCEDIELRVALLVDPYSTVIQIHFSGPIPTIYLGAKSITEDEKEIRVKHYYKQFPVDEEFPAAVLLERESSMHWGVAALLLKPWADTQWTKYNNMYNNFLAKLEGELPDANA